MFSALNYLGFSSPAAAEWATFAPEVLGLQVAAVEPDGSVRLKMDDADHRITIHPGEVNDLAYLGWGVASPDDIAATTERLAAVGIEVVRGDAALAESRRVVEVSWFVDEFGFRHEMSWGQRSAPASFRPGRAMSGFVTEAQGLGHAVMIVPDMDRADAFYRQVLGFRLSDQIDANKMRIRFYHCNGRHHSLALAEVPGAVGYHHVMLEVASIDDVGNALDLAIDRGVEVTLGLGRHVNDMMTSFYLRSPSAFEIEYGYGGVTVDLDSAVEPRAFDSTSIWGHRPPTGEYTGPGIVRPFKAGS